MLFYAFKLLQNDINKQQNTLKYFTINEFKDPIEKVSYLHNQTFNSPALRHYYHLSPKTTDYSTHMHDIYSLNLQQTIDVDTYTPIEVLIPLPLLCIESDQM
jgi:hypothetical protein